MAEAIPYKGAVLTQITAWWLRQLERDVRHHMLSADADEIIDAGAGARRSSRRRWPVARCSAGEPRCFPIECVIRGYLSGSAWKEYRERGTLAGESLPPGLRESERLDPPLFSPATKAESGHDENITIARDRGDGRAPTSRASSSD